MIVPNRRYIRRPASKDAIKIYIICEGRRREYSYFKYFQEMDSRIDIQVHELHQDDNNSPAGLQEIADSLKLEEFDKVWLVFDRDPDKHDSRGSQITAIRDWCAANDSREAAISNPCFEVWLHFHMYDSLPELDDIAVSVNWKSHVDRSISGGFDCRKHSVFISRAASRAEASFRCDDNDEPLVGSTQVFGLAKSILPLIADRLKEQLESIVESTDC